MERDIMKKPIFFFVLIVLITASLSAAPTVHTLVVDKNLPADQNAVVTFNESLFVKEWNNIDIEDELYGKKEVWSSHKARLTVPAGNTNFIFTALYSGSSYSYRYENIEIIYTLEPGKKYEIKRSRKSKGFLKGFDFFIEIYDVTGRGKGIFLKEWKIGEGL
jgi:hypothetical protein